MAERAGKDIDTQERRTAATSASQQEKVKAAGERRSNFLLWMLASIFAVQMSLFIGATFYCLNSELECPELGRRYDETFGTAIATVLALMAVNRK